jgi:ABC-type uncharacterized transport system permease subunit
MDNRKIYWLLVIAGAAAAVAGIFMKRSMDPAVHDKATIVGWAGIAVLLIARIVFRRKPKAQNVSDYFPPKKQG